MEYNTPLTVWSTRVHPHLREKKHEQETQYNFSEGRVNKSKTSKSKKGNSREESPTSALLLLFFFSWKNLKNKNAQVRILGELLALSFSLCVCVIFHFTGYIY